MPTITRKPVEITGTVQYEQSYGHRAIEDAEANHQTFEGSSLKMPLMKVVDISGCFDLKRGKVIHLAYFRLDYSNAHPYQDSKRLSLHDWACSIYVDGKIRAANMRLPYYFIEEMKKDEEYRVEMRGIIEQSMDFQSNEMVNAESMVQTMFSCVPQTYT